MHDDQAPFIKKKKRFNWLVNGAAAVISQIRI